MVPGRADVAPGPCPSSHVPPRPSSPGVLDGAAGSVHHSEPAAAGQSAQRLLPAGYPRHSLLLLANWDHRHHQVVGLSQSRPDRRRPGRPVVRASCP